MYGIRQIFFLIVVLLFPLMSFGQSRPVSDPPISEKNNPQKPQQIDSKEDKQTKPENPQKVKSITGELLENNGKHEVPANSKPLDGNSPLHVKEKEEEQSPQHKKKPLKVSEKDCPVI